ncbi:MAG: hypothetical protein ACR2LI_10845 [Propionibacteriaceae bacterium]
MNALLVAMDVIPEANVVQPGILPLILTIVLGGAVYLLYRSMKRQVKKIDLPYADELDEDGKVVDQSSRTRSDGSRSGTAGDINIR